MCWGGTNLPVCSIFKKGIDVFSWFSPSSGEEEFVPLFPILQVPHAAEQSMPCFMHEHLWEPQSDLPLHLAISYKDACCWWVSPPSTSFQPQSCGGIALNTSPLLYLVVNPEAVVDSGCRSQRETFGLYNKVPVVIFWRNLE